MELDKNKLHYLEQLSETFKSVSQASTEIINLQAIMHLPKGTEHFLSDIHGEYEAFNHVLKNGSGAVRKKIDDVFGHTLETPEKRALATLIYYPRERLEMEKESGKDMNNWYKVTLYRLIDVCKTVSSKYTRSKVRKALPKEYAYVIEELITEKPEVLNKEAYYDSIINTILMLDCADDFIIALSELIQRLVIDHLHVIGDIYDRGPGPHFIMDTLMNYHSVDIQWGNHDVVWMGASLGSYACMANVIRNSLRYGNLDILEDGYGINMVPLATYAMEVYRNDLCEAFAIKGESKRGEYETKLAMKMQKAITIMQFKAEGQVIRRRPEFGLDDRLLLDKIRFETATGDCSVTGADSAALKATIEIDGKLYELKDTNLPSVNPADPYAFSEREQEVMAHLARSFKNCEKLKSHMRFLLKKGSLYKIYNNNLLYHGCIPMNEDGSFREVKVYDGVYKGRELYDVLESYVRKAFVATDADAKLKGMDILWYLWCAPDSPLFGRSKMATFERYFLSDKETYKEVKNPYYRLLANVETADKILKEFSLHGEMSKIINGHVPVHAIEGENPVKAGGKVIIIDGGLSKAYHKETGIAGYTLTYNSYGLSLTSHEPFTSTEYAIANERDIDSRQVAVEHSGHRILVGDTDIGRKCDDRIMELIELIQCYRDGTIIEKTEK